jgi:hypothetical protein
VRAGNWKKHDLFRATANETQQKRGHTFKNNCLTNDEQDRYAGVCVAVANFELMQSLTKEMEDEKKIAEDEKGIDDQLDEKGSQGPGGFVFHEES